MVSVQNQLTKWFLCKITVENHELERSRWRFQPGIFWLTHKSKNIYDVHLKNTGFRRKRNLGI